jgi:hypothetical protein
MHTYDVASYVFIQSCERGHRGFGNRGAVPQTFSGIIEVLEKSGARPPHELATEVLGYK